MNFQRKTDGTQYPRTIKCDMHNVFWHDLIRGKILLSAGAIGTEKEADTIGISN